MRGKKGLDYIDWSISMGIFIVAVTALFVFLKPGARPEHDQNTLINLVERQFVKETQWFVHETPIYIRSLQDTYGSGAQALVEVDANGDIRFTAVEPATESRYEPILRTGTKITFDCHTSCNNNLFKLFGTTDAPLETTEMEVTCTPSNDPAVCKAVLGATVTYQGLQQGKITALQSADYNTVRTNWNYPLQKEFAIYQDGNKVIGGQEPTQQANIFVKEMKMNMIAADGAQTTTTINIRVW